MINSVTLKADGTLTQSKDAISVTLNAASVVTLNIGPEEVARFDKVGVDLVLVLKDGARIVIENFFVVYDDGRNDVVFVDENDVTWWAQYSETWDRFQIAEIEVEPIVPATAFAIPLAPLGLIGAAAAVSAGGGGDSGSDEEDTPPVAVNDTARVVESGLVSGDNDPETGVSEARGNVLDNDLNAAGTGVTVVSVDDGSGEVAVGTPIQGVYGTFVLQADGSYVFELDNSRTATQSLAFGETGTEVFTYSVGNGSDDPSSASITVSVVGTNDKPDVTGESDGVVEEDGVGTARGQLQVSDPDRGDSHSWSLPAGGNGTYGSFSVDASGEWTYTLDNDLVGIQTLAEGETLTDTTVVRATDEAGGWDEQEIVVTITGTNDAPLIAEASDLSGELAELGDGEVGENTDDQVVTGTIDLSDPDGETGDLVATVTPVVDDGSYFGDFTFEISEEGMLDWRFAVNDALLDGLRDGEVVTQQYVVTVTDPSGATATETVTVTITGRNDRPVAEDDSSVITVGQTAVLDVRGNDGDDDAGETQTLTVTEVDGQPISPGNPVTLASGTVSIDESGNLTFEPAPGVSGEVVLAYTIDDGSGTETATDTASWVVNIVNAAISDNASPAGQDVKDGVLASIDDLDNVVISGKVPSDGAITDISVTDGTDTVTIPIETITVNPDGTFSTTGDLGDLDDGTLTLVVEFEGEGGETITSTDTILKDTTTTVTVNPIAAGDGIIPTITGTGEPDDTLVLTIDGGSPITVSVTENGTWNYTPDAPFDTPEVDVSVTATDPYGNTATETREVVRVTVQDQVPGEPQDISVDESGLPDGSDPSSDSDSIVGTLNIGTSDGDIRSLSIGGTTVSITQLQGLGTTPIPAITTAYGELTIADYDPTNGAITYTYALDDNTVAHTNAAGVAAERDILRETIEVSVVDGDGDSRSTSLVVAIVDDIPEITALSGNSVALEASDASLGTNPSASFAGLFTVEHGADGAAASGATVYSLGTSVSGANSGLVDGATGNPILLTVEGGAVVGRTEGSGALAFRIDVDAATGVVTLDQQRVLQHPDGTSADVMSLADGAVQLTVTATDGDGDMVSQIAGIGGRLSFRDDVPVAVDDTATLAAEDTGPVTGNVVTGTVGVGADDPGADMPAVVISGQGSGSTATPVPGTGDVVIPGLYGDLTLSADGSYSYTRTANTPGDATDVFTYTLQDADGDTDEATLTITLGDAPVSIVGLTDEASGGDALVNESKLPDGTGVGAGTVTSTGSFTVSAFDGIASLTLTQGASSLTIVSNDVFQAGSVTTALGSTLSITGFDPATGTISYTYTLSDAEVHNGAGRDGLFEAFGISLTDQDGDSASGTLSVRVIDDIPVITATTEDTVALEASDATLGTNPSASFAGLFTVDHGADDAAVSGGTVYSLGTATPGADSGLVDGASGTPILLTVESGAVVGRVQGSGQIAFRVEVDPATGVVTLDQQRVLQHPDGTSADAVSLADGAVQLTVTATDGDGDVVTQTAGIGGRLSFRDDVPVALNDTANLDAGETDPVTGNVLSGSAGADDPGADVSGLVSAISGSGTTQTAVPTSGTVVITGTYGDLTISADGSYSYTRDPNTPGGVSDVFTYTLTDKDGDSDQATLTITIDDAEVSISNLTPQAAGGDAVVNESKLPGGSGFGTGASTSTGSFSVSAFDGIAELSLTQGSNSVVIVNDDVFTARTFTTALGSTLEITGFNPATGVVSYRYTLNAAETHGGVGRDDIFETFGISLTDRDGDTDTATLSVRIQDDVPVAENDSTNVTETNEGPIIGNVVTGTGGTGVDVQGADRPGVVTAVIGASGFATAVPGNGTVVIAGSYGDLTISANGGYSYARNTTTPSDVSDVFTYTLRDTDGDTDQATLSIFFGNAPVIIGGLTDEASGGDAEVNESKLPDGTGVGDGDATGNGSFTVTTFNGIANLSISQGGTIVPVVINDVLQTGPITLTTALGSTLEITGYDVTTGIVTYTYTLNDAESHGTAGRDDLFESFGIDLTDQDGDKTTGILSVRILDDIPVITPAGDVVVSLQASDAALAVNPSTSFAGIFDVDHGADGPATSGATVYALGIASAGVDSGLTDGATGDPIVLTLEGDDVVGRVGGTGSDMGQIAFTLVLNASTGEITLDQRRVLEHADGGGANTASITDTAVQLTVTATDADGDIVSETADIGARLSFVDDVPDAEDDTATLAAGSTSAVIGNVITDTPGADDTGNDLPATVTAVQGSGATPTPVPATGSVLITGTYGDLTIEADGSYSYARNPNTPGDVSDVFTYTLTDNDGDSDPATLTIAIGDSPVAISDLTAEIAGGDAFVNESKLPDGTDVGAGDDMATGTFTIDAFDGVANLSLSQGATTLNIITNDVLQTGPLTLTSALGNSLTITGYDAGSGVVSYNYTLNDAETHDLSGLGRDDVFESFGISLTDRDGDNDTGTLSVRILDDIPVITAQTGVIATLEVSDATLATDATVSLSGLFAVDHGADGAAAINGTVYSLSVSAAGVDSGLTDGASGDPVVLTLEGDDVVGRVGGTGSDMGEIAFRVAVNAATGEVTLDQQRVLEHADGAGTNLAAIADAAVRLTVTAIDGDGDVVGETANIGARLTFRDDVPSVTAMPDDDYVPLVLTTQDADTLAGVDTAMADFSVALEQTADFGGDGPASAGSVAWAYSLALQGGAASVVSGLSSEGDAITLFLDAGRIVGSTAATLGTVAAGNIVFAIDLAANGQITLSQSRTVDHTDTGSNSEVVRLAQDLIRLNGTVTVTDADDDTGDATTGINIGDSFGFADDGPVVGAEVPTPDLTEVDLRTSGSTTGLSRALNINFGADRDDGSLGVVFQATQTALDALGLRSGDVALTYVINGGLLTARAGSVDVFTVELQQPAPGNNFQTAYEFTLHEPLDHVVAGVGTLLSDLTLPFAITATDGDGDSADETFAVRIIDDTPTAVAQTGLSVVEGGAAIGSASGGVNLIDNDTQGADGARVHQVTYTDNSGVSQTVTITPPTTATAMLDTQYGTLVVNADGTWTYTPDPVVAHTGNAPASDGFTYTLIDSDGDVSAAVAQPISVTDTSPVAADDTIQSSAEGGAVLSGNVISNDTASVDGGTRLANFVYTNAAGEATPVVFTDMFLTSTVTTPTGSLTVNRNGSWSFAPTNSFDHDAPGADAAAGGFSYVLVDADGSTSGPATQPLTVTDTAPTVAAVSFQLDEADLANAGSAGATSGIVSVTEPLAITKDQDDIANVIFTTATVAGLPAALSSGGVTLNYSVSVDGHTLTATAGVGGPTVFTLVIDNPTDATGATQSITATLVGPLDQPSATLSNLTVAYQVQDIDSPVAGSATFTVVDDTPLAPVNDTAVTVVEGGAAVGSANTGANLLTNDTLGADTGRVYDITYLDRSGASQTTLVPTTGSSVVLTQYGTLTVQANGTWSYTPLSTVDHQQPGSDTTLNDDFTYRTVDRDGDISPTSATQVITVTDTVPAIGDPDDRTVNEANLTTGSSPNASVLTATGSLNVTPGQDSFAVTLNPSVQPTGLTSETVPLQYVFAGDNLSVIAYAGAGRTLADRVFSLTLTNPTAANAGYTFTLLGALDHDNTGTLDFDFGVVVTDSDNDTDNDLINITVLDDAADLAIARTIDEDGSVTVNVSADATQGNVTILQNAMTVAEVSPGSNTYKLAHGLVTVLPSGQVQYTPDPDFSGIEEVSGGEVFSVQVDDGTNVTTTSVTVTVNPVSDAPTLTADEANVSTREDTPIALGLSAPVIADDGTGTGNNARSERIGAITLTGLPQGATLLIPATGLPDDMGLSTPYVVPASGTVTIELSDIATEANASGDLTMTSAQYEGLSVRPPLHAHQNFTVTANVSSFEVDATGVAIATVPGAAATPAVVNVSVQAVTDDAALLFDTGVTTGVTNVTNIAYTGNTVAEVDIREDTTFDVRSILAASFADLDGSEARSIQITNGSGEAIRVGGQTLAAGATQTFNDIVQTGQIDSFPNMQIGGVSNFSGELNNITIRIVAQDIDGDGFEGGAAANGVTEANLANNAVTLNLNVAPVAGDVASSGLNVSTLEDTAVAFLQNIRLTDTSGVGGEEVISSVVFDLPSGWAFADSTTVNPATWTVGISGTTHTITFTGGTRAQREAVLDGFSLTPPAHSSMNLSLPVSVTSTDTNAITGTDTATVSRTVVVGVSPMAERIGTGVLIDTDGDTNADLGLTPGVTYTSTGTEDTWFALNRDGFDLAAGWQNQDGDEITFARLIPELDGVAAVGAQFRWTDGGTVVRTFSGTPIDVPVSALGTVEFLPPPNQAGRFRIDVQARTVDFDDDTEGSGSPSTAVSGQAELLNIDILPVADAVALTLNARVGGLEDVAIPLRFRPSSTDPSETFNITIRDIPDGAVINYGGTLFTATAMNTSFDIPNFDRNVPMTITPPFNSNDDFTLAVDAVSVDSVTIGGTPYVSTFSPPVTLSVNVAVKGVADNATVTVTPQTYVETDLDSAVDSVALADLVSVTPTDGDGSETPTLRISGLPDGFGLSLGALLTPPAVTGTARIWALNETQLANGTVTVPANYSGTVSFSVRPVTTENDGSSLTGMASTVTFSVTASPEATVSNSAVLVEDVVTTLGLVIQHQNGDTDERIGDVRIRVDQAATATYTLFLGTGGPAVPLSGAMLPTVNDGGVDYFVLTAAQAATLSARTQPHLDEALGSFELQYRIIDDRFGSELSAPVTSPFLSTNFALSAVPITDQPDLRITAISGTVPTTVTSDLNSGDDATPDRAALSEADVVTVTLNVQSPDIDGSERITRVIIENVPDGVTIIGAQIISADTWLLTYEDAASLPINSAGGVDIPVQFDVSGQVAQLAETDIEMTVLVQDRGNVVDPGTSVLQDSVTWTLTTTFPTSGGNPSPAIITAWAYNGSSGTEDVQFALANVMTATVNTTSTFSNTLTVQITDLPPGTLVEGMTLTNINGTPTWTASTVSAQGDDAATVQALLDTLMNSIRFTTAADANDNNNQPDGMSFNATLVTKVVGGLSTETATVSPTVPITPVTDAATLTIGVGAADNDGVLQESDPSIAFSVQVANPADGAAGSVVNNTMYLQLTGDVSGLQGGTLTDGTGTVSYPLTTENSVPGIAPGAYFVIPGTTMGGQVEFIYQPPMMVEGNLTVTAQLVNVETGASNLTSSQTEVLPIQIANNGVTAASATSSGTEAADTSSASYIELEGLSVALNDNDGSEELVSILLTNVPEGFLVFTGPNAGSAVGANPASNAGGDGMTNTWILSGEGASLPPYVAILPPQNWSGTISGLNLVVASGETTLSTDLTQTFAVGDIAVAPVANGVTALPTSSFGTEGAIVPFNFNISLRDAVDATVTANAPDENQETATLVLTGLGAHASLYLGTNLLTSGVSYNAGTDQYTITGLNQSQIDTLGFKQAIDALTDQDPGMAQTQIGVAAFTVDGAATSVVSNTTVTANLFAQVATTGNNTLLWTGQAINGLAGTDTVEFRIGEDLTGAELAARLTNIEALDLGIEGTNLIDLFTPEHLRTITPSGNALTVDGTADDTITLDGTWRELGGGMYTGVIAGPTETLVTLTVTGGVQVVEPAGGFDVPMMGGMSARMSRMAFDPDDSLGLRTLDDADKTETDEPAETAGAGSVALEDVLGLAIEESLDALLPEQETPATPTAIPDAGSDTTVADQFSATRSWEDDLDDVGAYEV